MIKKISIKNYKSIVDDEIELGRVNVFIGENGAGKSNILEAVAMFSAAKNGDLSIEGLVNRGIRITKPDLMTNSFHDEFKNDKIKIDLELNGTEEKDISFPSTLVPPNSNEINGEWTDTDFFNADEMTKLADTIFTKDSFKAFFDEKIEGGTPEMRKAFIEGFQPAIVKSFAKTHVKFTTPVNSFQIYTLSTPTLRGITQTSYKQPLGLNGENLDILLSTFNDEEWQLLMDHSHFISWLEKPLIDEKDILKFKGHKLGRSTSRLYFVDQFMREGNNTFAAENANEGALYVLFYLALFISKKTPSFFAIDNIETALNPKICRALIESITELAKKTGKQVLITTHNPAVLDGINLNDDDERLFVVSRNNDGHTKTKRIQFKPGGNQNKRKLSEYWMRGVLGGLPNNFI